MVSEIERLQDLISQLKEELDELILASQTDRHAITALRAEKEKTVIAYKALQVKYAELIGLVRSYCVDACLVKSDRCDGCKLKGAIEN